MKLKKKFLLTFWTYENFGSRRFSIFSIFTITSSRTCLCNTIVMVKKLFTLSISNTFVTQRSWHSSLSDIVVNFCSSSRARGNSARSRCRCIEDKKFLWTSLLTDSILCLQVLNIFGIKKSLIKFRKKIKECRFCPFMEGLKFIFLSSDSSLRSDLYSEILNESSN